MFNFLPCLLIDEFGGLGITRASIVSAVGYKTGDDSADSVVKIKSLINEVGPDFCNITNWPFLRSDLSFTIGTTAFKFSGASYLPATFKKVTAGHLVDGNDWYPLTEVSLQKSYEWINPAQNTGRPDEFCITRQESGFWEIQFNRQPDKTYTIELDIELQWTDLTSDSAETLMPKNFYGAFVHFVSLNRFIQQGDTENIAWAENRWSNDKKTGILDRLLAGLASPLRKKSVIVDPEYTQPFSYRGGSRDRGDYDR